MEAITALGSTKEEVAAMESVITPHVMAIMDQTGDTKIIWDMSKKAEVAHAEKTFNKLKKKGYLAYSVKKDGEKGTVLHSFDPKIEKMILAPRVVGG